MISACGDKHRDRISVLVVDDDRDTVETLALLLKANGYDSYGCHYSKDVMANVEKIRPDVVLLDLAMPGMSGYDIAEELRDNSDLRPKMVIAVTGYGQERDRQKTKEAGFDDHILKPFEWRELESRLDLLQH
jgi:DNA-binding response OmpR family regulator